MQITQRDTFSAGDIKYISRNFSRDAFASGNKQREHMHIEQGNGIPTAITVAMQIRMAIKSIQLKSLPVNIQRLCGRLG